MPAKELEGNVDARDPLLAMKSEDVPTRSPCLWGIQTIMAVAILMSQTILGKHDPDDNYELDPEGK